MKKTSNKFSEIKKRPHYLAESNNIVSEEELITAKLKAGVTQQIESLGRAIHHAFESNDEDLFDQTEIQVSKYEEGMFIQKFQSLLDNGEYEKLEEISQLMIDVKNGNIDSSNHVSYQEIDLSIDNPQDLKQAMISANVTARTESLKRVIQYAEDSNDDLLLKNAKIEQRNYLIFLVIQAIENKDQNSYQTAFSNFEEIVKSEILDALNDKDYLKIKELSAMLQRYKSVEFEELESKIPEASDFPEEPHSQAEEYIEPECELVQVEIAAQDDDFLSAFDLEPIQEEQSSEIQKINLFDIFEIPEFSTVNDILKSGGNIPIEVKGALAELDHAVSLLDFRALTPNQVLKIRDFALQIANSGTRELMEHIGDYTSVVLNYNPKYNKYITLPDSIIEAAQRVQDSEEDYTPSITSLNLIAKGVLVVSKGKVLNRNFASEELDRTGRLKQISSNPNLNPFTVKDNAKDLAVAVVILTKIQQEFFIGHQRDVTNSIVPKFYELIDFHADLIMKLYHHKKKLKKFTEDADLAKELNRNIEFLKSISSYADRSGIATPAQIHKALPAFHQYISIIQTIIDTDQEFSKIVTSKLQREKGNLVFARYEVYIRLNDIRPNEKSRNISQYIDRSMHTINEILAELNPDIAKMGYELKKTAMINDPVLAYQALREYSELPVQQRDLFQKMEINKRRANPNDQKVAAAFFEIVNQYL